MMSKTAAAPDALAWIREALPWLESLRDALRGAEGGAHLDQFYALDTLIARAKPEEVRVSIHAPLRGATVLDEYTQRMGRR